MPRSREGISATYIGHEANLRGSRCAVLSDEGRYCHVRWISGERVGRVEPLVTNLLAFDRPTTAPSAFNDDEFGFEESPRRVAVACRAVHESGGISALARSLEDAGYLGEMRMMVHEAIGDLRAHISRSATWSEVASDLGEDGGRVLGQLITEMVREALMQGELDVDAA